MRKLFTALVGASALACIVTPAFAQGSSPKIAGGSGASPTANTPLTARYTSFPWSGGKLNAPAASVTTTFTRSFNDGGVRNETFVGTDPSKPGAGTTTLTAVIVPLRLHLTGGAVFDPGTTTCGGAATARVTGSPVFKTANYTVGGTTISGVQYGDFFQRGEFFKYTGPGGVSPNYHVNFAAPVVVKTLDVDASTYPTSGTGCGKLGFIDVTQFDNFVRSKIASAVGTRKNAVPIFLMKNVVLYQGSTTNCCILGYHSAVGSALQTYSVADYDSSGQFKGSADVSALTHEISELINDPKGNNPTVPWGHIGQVGGCQTNLEVGDPLSGTTIKVVMSGFTYHPQEMAYASWFLHESPSEGLNGKYSSNGKFTTPAAVCH